MDASLLAPNAAVTFAELLLVGIASWLLILIVRLVLQALTKPGAGGKVLLTAEAAEAAHSKVSRLIRMLAGLGALAIVGYNVWLTSEGYDAWLLIREQFARLSPRVLAVMGAQIVGVIALLALLSWLGRAFQQWVVGRLQHAKVVCVSNERIEVIGDHLRHLIAAALWLVGATAIAGVLNIPETATWWITYLITLPLVWALMRLISDSLDVAIDAVYEVLRTSSALSWRERGEAELRKMLSSVKTAVRWGVYIAAAAYVVGAAPFGAAVSQFSTNLVKAVAVIVLAQVVIAIITAAIAHFASGNEEQPEGVSKHQETMLPLISSLVRYAIYFVAGVMALQTMGLNVTAILAGAGILGVAIGFGAQKLVEDVISGFFILFEGDYMVGDFIELGDVSGTVEELTLRETTIRRPDGALAIMRNGQMDGVINYCKHFVKAVVDVGVSYEGDLDHAISVLEQVALDAQEDLPTITGPPVIRVTAFNASDVGLRLLVPVVEGKHAEVASELRHRVKTTFDAQGVEIPFARQVMILQTAEGEPVTEVPVRLLGR